MPDNEGSSTTVQHSWADKVEREQEGYTEVDADAGIKRVVAYEERDEKRYRVIKTYRLVKEKVPMTVIARRSWAKFGEAEEGRDMATKLYQEVRMDFTVGQTNIGGASEDADGDGENAGADGGENVQRQTLFKCQHCRGPHYSMKCPYKSMIQEIKNSSSQATGGLTNAPNAATPTTLPSASAPGAYVVPGRRAGAGPSAASSSMYPSREELPTLRISNLTDSATEDDLRELINRIDPSIHVKRVHIPKDFDKKKSRGFAYITFDNDHDAERCLRVLNGMKYDHLLLHAEWAKK